MDAPPKSIENVLNVKKVGHITPSSNTVLEPLTTMMGYPIADRLSNHFTRIVVKKISLDSQDTGRFEVEKMVEAAKLLADANVDAILWNGTSGCWNGTEADLEICRRITEETSVPASTSRLAQYEVFKRYGAKKFALAVPYLDDVTHKTIAAYYGRRRDGGRTPVSDWILDKDYQIRDGVVRYQVLGEGPPLVLVHGTPFSSYVWREVAPALARNNTVYVFDLLGYGTSDKREGQDVSLAAQARLLAGLLDHWGLDRPNIVGHDFGGAVTLRTHLLEGRDFNAVALMDAVALAPWGSPFYRLVQDYVGVFRQIPAYMHRAMLAAYVRDATYRPMGDQALEPYIRPWLGAEGQEAFYRQISQNDQRYTDEIEPLYDRIEAPVMVLWGEEDRWIPLSEGERLHRAIPTSELRTISQCAHLAQEDATEAVIDHLTEFFARHTISP